MSKARISHILLTIVWFAVAGASLYGGLEYYTLSFHDRAYSDLHEMYKPSGFIGHGLGIVGSLMMVVGVAMYSIRKRMHRFEASGKLGTWLTAHIFLCTLGPYLVVLHTAFRFGGIVSIAFWSMMAVVLSGVFGRYVYIRIPKTANGQFYSETALQARQKHLFHSILEYHDVAEERVREVVVQTSKPVHDRSRLEKTTSWMKREYSHGSRKRKLLRHASRDGMADQDASRFVQRVMEYQDLVQQASVTGVLQRLFGYWHVFHLPLALIMLCIMLFHIGVAFTFGYFWIS